MRKGTNGFTCIPDLDAMEIPDLICADSASWQWINDAHLMIFQDPGKMHVK